MRSTEPEWPAPANVTAFTTLRPEPTRDELMDALPTGMRLSSLQQVHGTRAVDAALIMSAVPRADACFSREALVGCMVRTADCLPVLLCNSRGDEVAAIHAGWRGLAAGVIEATLDALRSQAGELMAWLGPAICQQHFEVGAEVRETFLGSERAPEVAACFIPGAAGKYQANLYALARLRLQGRGIHAIYGGDRCSAGDAENFYSWRRDGDDRRMFTVIGFC